MIGRDVRKSNKQMALQDGMYFILIAIIGIIPSIEYLQIYVGKELWKKSKRHVFGLSSSR